MQPGQQLSGALHVLRGADGTPAHILPQHFHAALGSDLPHPTEALLQGVHLVRRQGVAGIAGAVEHIILRAQRLSGIAHPGKNAHGVLHLAMGATEQVRLELGALGVNAHAGQVAQLLPHKLTKAAAILAVGLQKHLAHLGGKVPHVGSSILCFQPAIEGRAAQPDPHACASGAFSSSSVRAKDGTNSAIKSRTSGRSICSIARSTFSPAASNSWLPARCSSMHLV